VWFPGWALRSPGSPSAEPRQAIDEGGRVVAINAAAYTAGVRLEMRRAEAEAICPNVETIQRDRGAEMVAFEPVVAAVESLIPRVEVTEPGLVYVPIAGAVAYYGGEAPLVERVVKELVDLTGGGFRIGLASGPFAARQAAARATADPPVLIVEDDAAFLASLDIGTIGSEELVATFRWLGITTLGELARLPRGAITSRFGAIGLAAHLLAAGADRDVLTRVIPSDVTVERRFDPPLEDMEQVGFIARSMASYLVEELAAMGTAPFRITVVAEAADGTIRSRVWRSADPLDEAAIVDRVRWQLRAWVEGPGAGVRGGLAVLRIEPADLSDQGRQLSLGEDPGKDLATQRALAATQAIVGIDGLLQAEPQGGRDPLDRVSWHRWGEDSPPPKRDLSAPWQGSIPSPSPALVPPEPRRLEVEWDTGMPSRVRMGSRWEPVLSWAGPWRRFGRWWQGEGVADRYQIVTSAGALLCEVRDGETWLIGIYD
jgi:protein ImuB